MNYLMFNHDGSIKATNLVDIITQGSNTYVLYVYVEGYSPSDYVADAKFILPYGEPTTPLEGTLDSFKPDGETLPCYKIQLTEAQTYQYGNLECSIEIRNQDPEGTILFTKSLTLVINKTTYAADEQTITAAQFKNLQSTLATLEIKFSENNVRCYETLSEYQDDLENLSVGQICLVEISKEMKAYIKTATGYERYELGGVFSQVAYLGNISGTTTIAGLHTQAGNAPFTFRYNAMPYIGGFYVHNEVAFELEVEALGSKDRFFMSGSGYPSTTIATFLDPLSSYYKPYVTEDELDVELANKADLVDGKVPLDQLPNVGAVWGSIAGTLSNQTDLQDALNSKQNALTFDNSPTQNSNNPVKSGGVYTSLQGKADLGEDGKVLSTQLPPLGSGVPYVEDLSATDTLSDIYQEYGNSPFCFILNNKHYIASMFDHTDYVHAEIECLSDADRFIMSQSSWGNTTLGDFMDETTDYYQPYARSRTIAPFYSASNTYNLGELVIHNGQLYICSTAIDIAEAWNSAHWTAVSFRTLYVDYIAKQSQLTAKADLVDGKVPASQLPSYVDDVVELGIVLNKDYETIPVITEANLYDVDTLTAFNSLFGASVSGPGGAYVIAFIFREYEETPPTYNADLTLIQFTTDGTEVDYVGLEKLETGKIYISDNVSFRVATSIVTRTTNATTTANNGLIRIAQGMSNPMNAQGDLIVGSTGGTPSKLAIGSNGQVLTSNGTTATWATPTTYSSLSPSQGGTDLSLVTTGEKYSWNSKQDALPSVTNDRYLHTNASTGALEWASISSGMTNPMTSQGDLIYGGSSGTPTALAKGTAGQLLAMNSGATAPEWKTVTLPPMGTAYGNKAVAIGDTSIAGASGNDYFSSAYGYYARATGNNATAIGKSSIAGLNSTAIGANATCNTNYSTVVGEMATATAQYATAIGKGAYSSANYSTALGAYAQAAIASTVSIYGYGNSADRSSTLLVKDPSHIFFANQNATSTTSGYTSLSQFVSGGGKYLADYLMEANPTIPSGTTPTALTGLKVGLGSSSTYYSLGGGGTETLGLNFSVNTHVTLTEAQYDLLMSSTKDVVILARMSNGADLVFSKVIQQPLTSTIDAAYFANTDLVNGEIAVGIIYVTYTNDEYYAEIEDGCDIKNKRIEFALTDVIAQSPNVEIGITQANRYKLDGYFSSFAINTGLVFFDFTNLGASEESGWGIWQAGTTPAFIITHEGYDIILTIDDTYSSGDYVAKLVLTKFTHQEELVSGTNIKTVNGSSILGSGNVAIESVKTGTEGSATSVSLKFWQGTQQQYDAITTKDANTLYIVKGS